MSNEVFFMAFPRMLVLCTLSKGKDLEKSWKMRKDVEVPKGTNGSGALAEETLRENNLFSFP